MHKVIVERPRRGGYGKQKYLKNVKDPEELPSQESMKRCHGDRKELNENLAPLKRWLQSKVGQKWDDVYSEACEVIKPTSTVKNHVKVHLLQYVEQQTLIDVDGVVYYRNNYGWKREEDNLYPVDTLPSGSFWVHPVKKTLEMTVKRRRRNYKEEREKEQRETLLILREDTTVFRGKERPRISFLNKIEGIWYYIEATQQYGLPIIGIPEMQHPHGGVAAVMKKLQLNHTELKRYGLKNGVQSTKPSSQPS